MTHDELLAKIDTLEVRYTDYSTYLALRAVVELHRPIEVATGGSWTPTESTQTFRLQCRACSFVYLDPYPCPTIQAIEKELNG